MIHSSQQTHFCILCQVIAAVDYKNMEIIIWNHFLDLTNLNNLLTQWKLHKSLKRMRKWKLFVKWKPIWSQPLITWKERKIVRKPIDKKWYNKQIKLQILNFLPQIKAGAQIYKK